MKPYIVTLYYHNELQPIVQKIVETNHINAINKVLNNSKKTQKIDRIDVMEIILWYYINMIKEEGVL